MFLSLYVQVYIQRGMYGGEGADGLEEDRYGGESADGLEEDMYLGKRGSRSLMVAKAV
jgi:hypothetical protein